LITDGNVTLSEEFPLAAFPELLFWFVLLADRHRRELQAQFDDTVKALSDPARQVKPSESPWKTD